MFELRDTKESPEVNEGNKYGQAQEVNEFKLDNEEFINKDTKIINDSLKENSYINETENNSSPEENKSKKDSVNNEIDDSINNFLASLENDDESLEKKVKEDTTKYENIITDGSHIKDGKLEPNCTYSTGEHNYIYKTNQDGCIINARTDKLELKNHEGRLKHNTDTLGKQEGDHAGHLFGDRFGGSPELDNLVSQSKEVNLSEYKVIENQWAKALENGQEVAVDIEVNYLQGEERPTSFDVFYTIEGMPMYQTIDNNLVEEWE